MAFVARDAAPAEATLGIRLAGILSLAFSDLRVRIGDCAARSGEAVRVAPGRVRVRVEGKRLLPDRRYDLACEFETDVAAHSRVVIDVPSRQVARALGRIDADAFAEYAHRTFGLQLPPRPRPRSSSGDESARASDFGAWENARRASTLPP